MMFTSIIIRFVIHKGFKKFFNQLIFIFNRFVLVYNFFKFFFPINYLWPGLGVIVAITVRVNTFKNVESE